MRKNKGFLRVYKAAYYSYRGLISAVRYEASFRQELFFACVLLPLAFFFDVTVVERILLVASVLLVLIVELLNSAVEAVVDRIGEEQHELAGRAKDLGSAAVFLCILLWAFVWASILLLR